MKYPLYKVHIGLIIKGLLLQEYHHFKPIFSPTLAALIFQVNQGRDALSGSGWWNQISKPLIPQKSSPVQRSHFYCIKKIMTHPPGQPSHPFEASIYGSKHGETYRKSLHSDGLRGANKGRNISRDEWMVIDCFRFMESDIFGLEQTLEKHWC